MGLAKDLFPARADTSGLLLRSPPILGGQSIIFTLTILLARKYDLNTLIRLGSELAFTRQWA